ncbi:hypothetical protein HYS94_04300 [Candidatus Daviesbacteria bacterium]|nr:hypothetical protein [Candidatus Daviesbacteria bacterium]
MFDLFTALKTFVVSVAASVGVISAPVVSVTANPSIQPTAKPLVVTSTPVPVSSPNSTSLPLNEENYIYVQGTYSYLGQSVKYLFLVPRKGGSFSGSINGACDATVNGDYAGGESGKISGNASGSCKILFAEYKGSISYRGFLFPESKKIILDVENFPLKGPLTINYN